METRDMAEVVETFRRKWSLWWGRDEWSGAVRPACARRIVRRRDAGRVPLARRRYYQRRGRRRYIPRFRAENFQPSGGRASAASLLSAEFGRAADAALARDVHF